MKIEAVDFFYLSMPEIRDIGDGSQDALLVRLEAGEFVGWGECEASPLVSIAAFVCPWSHSACKPVGASVLGQQLDSVADIARIGTLVRSQSLDLLQAPHTFSGIDIAMWDLLGQRTGQPVYRLLGFPVAYPKTPYASQLFGDDPEETLKKGRQVRKQGFVAAKFGWGPFGKGTARMDEDQLYAAREGLGEDGILLIDAGTVWVDNVSAAQERVGALRECRVLWLEEPFVSGAFQAYCQMAASNQGIRLAAGEGCHDYYMARNMIDCAGIDFIQIDTGRVGGITTAKSIADYARSCAVTYVNHTFTSHLALSASLQPYAGNRDDYLCEYPVESQPLATELTRQLLLPDANGQIAIPDGPGLGVELDLASIQKYSVDVKIQVKGEFIYQTPSV
jgi:L-alanine-DL-glutamate epimerase-like enolase superfamily enzyme